MTKNLAIEKNEEVGEHNVQTKKDVDPDNHPRRFRWEYVKDLYRHATVEERSMLQMPGADIIDREERAKGPTRVGHQYNGCSLLALRITAVTW